MLLHCLKDLTCVLKQALKVVCEHELVETQKKDALEHSSIEVEADVRNILEGKTYEELKVILKQVHLFKAKVLLSTFLNVYNR